MVPVLGNLNLSFLPIPTEPVASVSRLFGQMIHYQPAKFFADTRTLVIKFAMKTVLKAHRAPCDQLGTNHQWSAGHHLDTTDLN